MGSRTVLCALACIVLLGAVWPEQVAAQRDDWPTNCTQATSGATIFIGHDCGEWASIMIVGRIEIRKPWNRTTRASRAVRIRERREGRSGSDAAPLAATDSGDGAPAPPPSGDPCNPAYGGCLPVVDDLNCGDIGNQQVEVFDVDNDPYGLDVRNGPGNGVTCDDRG